MSRILKVCLPLFLSCCVATVWAASAQEYCNEQYPEESYDAEDRAFYLQECVAAYQDDTAPASDVAEDASYYNGTVEQFVSETPEETTD